MVTPHSISGSFVTGGTIESNCSLVPGGGVMATRLGSRLTCSDSSSPTSSSQTLVGSLAISRCREPPASVSRRHRSLEIHHSVNVPFFCSRSSPMNENSTFSRNAGAFIWRISEAERARDNMASPRDCTVCATSDVAANTTNKIGILDRNSPKLHSATAEYPGPRNTFPGNAPVIFP